jgi:Rha family phage regulatory protein
MNNLIINNPFGITERKGIPVVSSRYVADVFKKNHDKVMRDIKNLECSKEFSTANFGESNYKVRGKTYPEYIITKDGFTFLAMGFTGKKAAQFKESYINAFNQMESFIRNLIDAKADFPEFTDAIMAAHEEPKHYHFSNELNMINKIVTGMEARQYKEAHGIDKSINSIRPYLSHDELEAVKSLQRIDIGLIYSMPDYYERKRFLETQFNRLRQKDLPA